MLLMKCVNNKYTRSSILVLNNLQLYLACDFIIAFSIILFIFKLSLFIITFISMYFMLLPLYVPFSKDFNKKVLF